MIAAVAASSHVPHIQSPRTGPRKPTQWAWNAQLHVPSQCSIKPSSSPPWQIVHASVRGMGSSLVAVTSARGRPNSDLRAARVVQLVAELRALGLKREAREADLTTSRADDAARLERSRAAARARARQGEGAGAARDTAARQAELEARAEHARARMAARAHVRLMMYSYTCAPA